MRNNHFIPFIIFSVQPDHFDKVIHQLDEEHVAYKLVEGCYEGHQEQSILVGSAHQKLVYGIALSEGQHTVLEVDGFRTARLFSVPDRNMVSIGVWHKAKHGVDYDSWTLSEGVKWVVT